MKNAIDRSTPYLPLIGRILMATIFIASGLGKIAAPEQTIGYIGAVGLPFPTFSYLLAVALEVGGGLQLLFGFNTRYTALLLAGFSVVTGLVFHNAIGDQNQLIHLLKNFALAGGLLQVAAFGAGVFSLDNRDAQRALAHAV